MQRLLIILITFLGAAMLFWVQPLVGKSLLPTLGGTSGVWTTCMVFFQAVLLGGYLYAHFGSRFLAPFPQLALHAGLMIAIAFWLPRIGDQSVPDDLAPGLGGFGPQVWLLGTLARDLGAPLLLLSATSPLLQRWWSAQPGTSARDPYFLYAFSNTGSFLALLGFPWLLEPNLSIRTQAWLWNIGFFTLTTLTLLTLLYARGKPQPEAGLLPSSEPAQTGARKLSLKRYGSWILLAFVPSSLLLGTTTHITTDVASMPLLWVVPLALYLGSFILVFARRPPFPQAWIRRSMPIAAATLVFLVTSHASRPAPLILTIALLFLFLACMGCHGRLAADRPAPDCLTAFYLCLASGGMLGGCFNGLIAPVAFSSVAEYPLMILLAVFLARDWAASSSPNRSADNPVRRGSIPADASSLDGTVANRACPPTIIEEGRSLMQPWLRDRIYDVGLPVLLGLLSVGLVLMVPHLDLDSIAWRRLLTFGLPAFLALAFSARPLRFTLALTATMAGGWIGVADNRALLHQERSFFGVSRVSMDPQRRFRRFVHGNTLHGRQFADPKRACEPTGYYHAASPLQAILRHYQSRPATPEVAVVGLGAGCMAVHGRPGEHWTFYEIDPVVVRIATDTNLFTFLKQCATMRWRVEPGDARVRLRDAPNGSYGLIVLDAFSSDAVPAHLLTREAFELYLAKLAPGGFLAVHISNRSLDLAPVLGRYASERRIAARRWDDDQSDPGEGRDRSDWVVLARNVEDLAPSFTQQPWNPVEVRADVALWTDDYSNLWRILRWR